MTGAAKLISDLAARGVNVKIPAASKLRLIGPPDAVEAVRNEVARRKFEIISFLESTNRSTKTRMPVASQSRSVLPIPDVDQFEEIAARIEYEENSSRDEADNIAANLMGFGSAGQFRHAVIDAWRDALAATSERFGTRYRRQHRMISDGLALLDAWGNQAVKFGWNSCELFGVCPTSFDLRLDRCGLAYFVDGGRVHSVDRNLAEIETATQALDRIATTKILYRHVRNSDGGAVPVWEFQSRCAKTEESGQNRT